MRRILRWSLRIFAALFLLLILMALAVIFVLNSETGTRWAIAQANQRMEGNIEIGEFEGSLWKGLDMPSFGYIDASQDVRGQNVRLQLDWASVLSARVVLKSLRADSIEIVNKRPPKAAPEPLDLSMQGIPVYLAIRKGDVGRFSWIDTGRRVDVHDIEMRRVSFFRQNLRAAAISGRYDALQIQIVELDMSFDGDVPIRAAVDWSLADNDWAGTGTIGGSLAELAVQQDVSGDYPAIVDAELYLLGRVEPEVDALVNWNRWTFGDTAVLDGEVRLSGWLDQYMAEYSATVEEPRAGLATISGTATGDTDGLSEFDATASHADADLLARGSLQWLPEFSASARVNGTLRDAAVDIDGDVTLGKEEIRCTKCVAQIGANRLNVDGVLGNLRSQPGVVVSFAVDAPALQQVLPDYSGGLTGNGTISGSLDKPVLNGRFSAEQLAYQDAGIGSGTVNVRGNAEVMQVAADWNVIDIGVVAEGILTMQEESTLAQIGSATITEPNSGVWRLQDKLELRIAGSNVKSNTHRWAGQHGELLVRELATSGSAVSVDARLENMPMSAAQRFLPPNYALQGGANADIQLQRRDGLWNGVIAWRQIDTVLQVTELNDETTDILIPRTDVNVNLSNSAAQIVARMDVEPGVRGDLEMRMNQLDADADIDATLNIDGDDWSWMSALVPVVDNFQGAIHADLRATGPLRAPELTGNLSWKEGAVAIPSLNVPVTDIDLSMTGRPDGALSLRGSATAGSGSLTASGEMLNVMQSDRSLELSLQGLDAELINWPEYRLWASPDLNVAWSAAGWTVGGEVTVPRAEIVIEELPEEAVTVSSDVSVIGREEQQDFSTRYSGEVKLILGDAVRIEAFGLKTGLSGELQFRQRPNLEPRAEGRVRLTDGVFEAYGQKLTIEEGTLTFTGPIDNPLVDVRAVRTIETFEGTVKAGIHLSGRGQAISSTVYAEPAMAEADALSYLLIGRPLNEATQSEGGELSGAAVALGIRQATRITQQIGQSLGLDQLTLAGDGGDTTALVAGKQLNNRLHARYAYGVFSRLGTLLLRYRLSKRLTLEAATGETQSIDLLYQVEKK